MLALTGLLCGGLALTASLPHNNPLVLPVYGFWGAGVGSFFDKIRLGAVCGIATYAIRMWFFAR